MPIPNDTYLEATAPLPDAVNPVGGPAPIAGGPELAVGGPALIGGPALAGGPALVGGAAPPNAACASCGAKVLTYRDAMSFCFLFHTKQPHTGSQRLTSFAQ